MRYAVKARVDASQAVIVEGLRRAGVQVWIIGRPCDLLCRYWSIGSYAWLWQTLECKTPTKSGKRRSRRDQEAQARFLGETQTPVVFTLEDALIALKLIKPDQAPWRVPDSGKPPGTSHTAPLPASGSIARSRRRAQTGR